MRSTHLEDFQLCTICNTVTKNPHVAMNHLKRSHTNVYNANKHNPSALIQTLSNDILGKPVKKPCSDLIQNQNN